MEWRIGCSGYHYPEWKNLFYPEGLPQRKWFDHYALHFNSIELNTTFYRFPQVSFLSNWYEKSPPGFTFSVKVPRAITHYKQFLGTERMLGDFYNTSREGLAEKLGCILFQLPSRLVYTKERLARILNSLDYSFNNIMEFRHLSWWDEEVYFSLKERNVSFCSMSHPDLPDYVVTDTPVIYYRFHGVPKIYKSQYKKEKVEEIIAQVQNAAVENAYIYFNNTMGMGGIRNAKQALRYIKKS
jgi:uncharacterized protein YecE (DUF72 family)